MMTEKQLPEPVSRRGISEPEWRTAATSLYPGADVNSILMVFDYCRARKLDPMKKPCHIVPMEVRDSKTGRKAWRDVVMPGIYELRTTAMRTGFYLGHSRPEYGDEIKYLGVVAPEWMELTIYRWNEAAQMKTEFTVRTYFSEVLGTTKNKDEKTNKDMPYIANARWAKAPRQMLAKCCEAAGLREAFPDELGGTWSAEEMEGQRTMDVEYTRSDISETKADAWESCDDETQNRIADISIAIKDYLDMGDNESAWKAYAEADLNAEEQVALWGRLDSKQRSALKQARPESGESNGQELPSENAAAE